MELYSSSETYKLYNGNMLDMLEVISPNSIDAIVTDPPYELNFMDNSWDNSGVAFHKETWEKCIQVLKPGGYLLCFAAPRMQHRIACAIEDAGFEIRDTIMWIFGSGFSKSLNLGKSIESKMTVGSANTQEFKNLSGHKIESGDWGLDKNKVEYGSRSTDYSKDKHLRTVDVSYTTAEGLKWDGWGTQMKPAYEPIIVARKPCEGSITDNVLKWGVGGINIDDCRIPHNEDVKYANRKPKNGSVFNTETCGYDSTQDHSASPDVKGRFPSNIILTYDETDEQEVCGGFPDSGSGNGGTPYSYSGREYHNKETSMFNGDKPQSPSNYNDSGSAARYFYCAKASRKDRDEGLEEFMPQVGGGMSGTADQSLLTGSGNIRDNMRKNFHPTVKPVSLCQYLIRLVTPDGGTVLDPFNGSGSTGKAVMYENYERRKGYKYIGIELTEQYLPIAKARIEYAISGRFAWDDRVTKKSNKYGDSGLLMFDLDEIK